MNQSLNRTAPNQKYFARKLSDGSHVEIVVGHAGVVIEYKGDLARALRETVRINHPIARAILNSGNAVLVEAKCSRELAHEIKNALYGEDEKRVETACLQLSMINPVVTRREPYI